MMSDTTAPVLHSVTLSQSTLNIGQGQTSVLVTARFSDDSSGIFDGVYSNGLGGSPPQIRFVSPSGQTIDGLFDIDHPLSGNRLDGIYTAKVTLSSNAEAGAWRVQSLLLNDEAGNTVFYRPETSALLSGQSFNVINSAGDVAAPILHEISLSHSSINLANGQNSLLVSAHFTDDLSGVFDGTFADGTGGSPPQIRFVSEDGKDFAWGIFDIAHPVSGSRLDGTYTATVQLEANAKAGLWKVDYLLLNDEAGNSRTYRPTETNLLSSLTFNVSTDGGEVSSGSTELSTGYFSKTGDSIIDGTTSGYKWILGTSRTVDFAVANGFKSEYWNDIYGVGKFLGAALNTFSDYADIKFNSAGYFLNPTAAFNGGSDITLSMDGSGALFQSNNVWAMGFFPSSGYNSIYNGAPGDVFLNVNSEANYLPSYEPGSQGWFLLMHELGHTLGLKHPHDDGTTGRPTFSNLGMGSLDIDLATIMSYNDDGGWNQFVWDPATPMILDVYALQYLYGKNLQTNAGNSVLKLSTDSFYKTIWDASGEDTIDGSLCTSGWTIFMPNQSLSTLVDTKAGYALPNADVNANTPSNLTWLAGDYEHVIGTNFADTIVGNLFNNRIKGSGGNDLIDGGAGSDLAVFTGARSQYLLNVQTGVVTDTQANRDGSDTLSNVERLKFSDINLAFDSSAGQIAGEAYRIYKAAFDRAPDAGGLGFWINAMDDGASLLSVAAGFISSPEFQKLYGANVSDRDYVTKLYNNVLDRNPDQGGYDFWLGALNNGVTREDILVNFSESKENIANVAELIAGGIQYQEWLG